MYLKLLIQNSIYLWLMFCLVKNVGLAQPSKPNHLLFDPNATIHKWVGNKIPDFNLKDLEGNSFDNKSIKDKIVVLNLWSITCHPCLDEIPLLNNLVDKYSNRGVVFLALTPESSNQINKALSTNNFKYKVLPEAQAFFESIGLPGYPYHIVLNREGIIRFIKTGTINIETGKKIAETDLPEAVEKELK